MSRATSDPSLTQLAEILARRGDEAGDSAYLCAVRDERTLSYAEMAEAALDWRTRFAEQGVGPDSTLGIGVSEPLAFATAFIAGLAAGLWVVPMDPNLASTRPEAFSLFVRRVALTHHLSGAAGKDPQLERLSSPSMTRATGGGVVMASSGTTGTPKVMSLSASQLLATARLVAAHNELTPDDRGLNPLPLFHINAEVVGLLATLQSGASLALDERFHRTDFWHTVERLSITWINAVPAIISRLLPLRDDERVPAGVRFVRSASAPLAASLMTDFEAVTGLPVIESYGMTEAASQICANPLSARRAGSVGQPVGVSVRVTLDGHRAEPGVVGSVEVTGPTVITAYESEGYEDRFTPDGWLRTGDNGFVDDDGYLFLVGRSDDVINRGGEKIYPREIEELLEQVAEVQGAAVIAVPDAVFGQVAVAYVQLHGVDSSSPRESVLPVLKELRERLVSAFPRTRRPATLQVVEDLPAHATGKIQRGMLRSEPPTSIFSEPVG